MPDPTRQVVEEVVASVLARRLSGGPSGRRLALGSDHAGFKLKQVLMRFLQEELEWGVMDCGTNSEEPVDYPDIALRVAHAVARGEVARGIMIDGAGVGSTMIANRVPGVLAAPGFDLFTVRNSRQHNDANLLVLGSRNVSSGEARRLVRVWLSTPFEGGRHARRVEKIRQLDQRHGRETP